MNKPSSPELEDCRNEEQAQPHSELQQAPADLSPTHHAKPLPADPNLVSESNNQTSTLTI